MLNSGLKLTQTNGFGYTEGGNIKNISKYKS